MNLFQAGEFVLRSGKKSGYKLECDALTAADWAGVAAMAKEEGLLPRFRYAHGVPRGGLPLAEALLPFATRDPAHPVLIVEDVVTTGGSMERYRAELETTTHPVTSPVGYVGLCLFARGPVPAWVTPIFQLMKTWPEGA